MKKITLILSACIAVSTFSFAQNNGKIALQQGQKLLINSKINSFITQEMMGTTIEINADLNSNVTMQVKSAGDKYELDNTITHMDLNATMMGKDMKYDSDKKEDRDSEMGGEFSKIINKPTPVTISNAGKVIKNKDGKDKAALMGGIAGDPTSAFEAAFLVVPTNAKAGSSWIDSSSEDGTIKSTTYTIREIKDKNAVVDIKGTIKTSGTQEVMGNEVKVNTSGTVAGEAIVDIASGIVTNHAVTIESTGTSEIMGQEIPVSTKVISKTTVTPGK